MTTNVDLVTERWNRKPSSVIVALVTEENMTQVAGWCGGEVRIPAGDQKKYIKIEGAPGTKERHCRAYAGDRVLQMGTSFKVWPDHSFRRSYEESSLTVSEPVEISETVGTPIFDEVYEAIKAALLQQDASTYSGESSDLQQLAKETAQRVVVLARGDGKTQLIPSTEGSVFFEQEDVEVTKAEVFADEPMENFR